MGAGGAQRMVAIARERHQKRDPWPAIGCSWWTALRRFWSGAFSFRERASRAEFWWIRLSDVVVVILVLWAVPQLTGVPNDESRMTWLQNMTGFLGIGQSIFGLDVHLDSPGGGGVSILRGGPPAQWILFVWFALSVIPNLALGFRRLHDRGMPGWPAVFGVLPIFELVLLVIALGPSVPFTPADATPRVRSIRHRRRSRAATD